MSSRATLLGVVAILMWSTFTALMRTVTESFGVTGGIALVYSVGIVLLCLKEGLPKLHKFPKRYLFVCGLLFISYEILLSQSIGLANTREQAIEVSLINYLWPCLVVVFALIINKQRVNYLIWPGITLSFLGVFWSLSGGDALALGQLIEHILVDPLPYLLAFIAAILWGLYCNLSKRFNNGNNGVPLFFFGIALVLWLKFWLGDETIKMPSTIAVFELLLTGALVAISYVFWEIGIQKGNLLLLAILSYFTPISSILFAGLWLNAMPSLSFWYGVMMVTIGSLLCWLATRKTTVKVVEH